MLVGDWKFNEVGYKLNENKDFRLWCCELIMIFVILKGIIICGVIWVWNFLICDIEK